MAALRWEAAASSQGDAEAGGSEYNGMGLREQGWLTVEESTQLLKRIFPNYPNLTPARPVPPRETRYDSK